MAFQLVDDILDLTSTQETLGKPVASDLKEGKMTLPVSLVMSDGRPEEASMVQTVISEREFRSVNSRDILTFVEKYDGLGRTRRIAEDLLVLQRRRGNFRLAVSRCHYRHSDSY
jgi:octaprenyl-diphosphate synthase